MLCIKNLHASIEETPILQGVNLTVNPGEIHAIMGPNGSGKSTLVSTLAGHPAYTVTNGSVEFNGVNILEQEPHERALAGMFLAFQYPKEIAGVTLRSFLYAAHKANMQARYPDQVIHSPIKFKKLLKQTMEELHMDPIFADRSMNKGFSGGEKKKAEILQLQLLKPTLALLDETDSGLDVDALKIVAQGVNNMRSPTFSAIIVTHYARILDYITPDYVHVMTGGKITKSGGADFAKELETDGYKGFAV
jgi:Fe-S cluster assembly ATP-binding protein